MARNRPPAPSLFASLPRTGITTLREAFLLLTLPAITRLLCLARFEIASTTIATRAGSESFSRNLSRAFPFTNRKRLILGLTVSLPTLIVTVAEFESPPSLPAV